MNMLRIHNTMEDKTMNYVKLVTISALLLAVPAASANWFTDNAVYRNAADALSWGKKKQAKPWVLGVEGAALATAGVVGYRYVPAVRKNVDKAAKSTKQFVQRNPKRAIVIGSSALLLAAIAGAQWKFGLWSKLTGLFSRNSAAAGAEVAPEAEPILGGDDAPNTDAPNTTTEETPAPTETPAETTAETPQRKLVF